MLINESSNLYFTPRFIQLHNGLFSDFNVRSDLSHSAKIYAYGTILIKRIGMAVAYPFLGLLTLGELGLKSIVGRKIKANPISPNALPEIPLIDSTTQDEKNVPNSNTKLLNSCDRKIAIEKDIFNLYPVMRNPKIPPICSEIFKLFQIEMITHIIENFIVSKNTYLNASLVCKTWNEIIRAGSMALCFNAGFKINYENIDRIEDALQYLQIHGRSVKKLDLSEFAINDETLGNIIDSCPYLTELNINARKITNDGILNISKLQILEILSITNISTYSKCTNFLFLKDIPKLKSFAINHLETELNEIDKLFTEKLEYLNRKPHSEYMSVVELPILENIEALMLNRCKCNISNFDKFYKLKKLMLDHYRCTDHEKPSISNLTNLRSLSIIKTFCHSINFTDFNNLEFLRLDFYKNTTYFNFNQLQNLKSLVVSNNWGSDEVTLDIESLSNLNHLELIDGYSGVLNLEKFEHLKTLKSREAGRLTIVGYDKLINLEVLSAQKMLKEFENLEKLTLLHVNFSETQFIDLSKLTRLQNLFLWKMTVTKEIKGISNLSKLTNLIICNSSSFEYINLKNMDSLRRINFAGCSNLIVEGAKNLKNLKQVDLRGCFSVNESDFERPDQKSYILYCGEREQTIILK